MKSLWSSQNGAHDAYLIAGLGNPGTAYEETRHNIGFAVVRLLAQKNGWTFRPERKLSSALAQGWMQTKTGKKKTLLVLPMTYMNSSGEAVRLAASFFKVKPQRILIVVDDVALSFGQIRFRESGSSGGHNGLKSVEEHLRTQDYPRLRIGVGAPRAGQDLADYVLERFSLDEQASLPSILEKGTAAIEEFVLN